MALLISLKNIGYELTGLASLSRCNSGFLAHCKKIVAFYGPMAGRAVKPVVFVQDRGQSTSARSHRRLLPLASTGSRSNGY